MGVGAMSPVATLGAVAGAAGVIVNMPVVLVPAMGVSGATDEVGAAVIITLWFLSCSVK